MSDHVTQQTLRYRGAEAGFVRAPEWPSPQAKGWATRRRQVREEEAARRAEREKQEVFAIENFAWPSKLEPATECDNFSIALIRARMDYKHRGGSFAHCWQLYLAAGEATLWRKDNPRLTHIWQKEFACTFGDRCASADFINRFLAQDFAGLINDQKSWLKSALHDLAIGHAEDCIDRDTLTNWMRDERPILRELGLWAAPKHLRRHAQQMDWLLPFLRRLKHDPVPEIRQQAAVARTAVAGKIWADREELREETQRLREEIQHRKNALRSRWAPPASTPQQLTR